MCNGLECLSLLWHLSYRACSDGVAFGLALPILDGLKLRQLVVLLGQRNDVVIGLQFFGLWLLRFGIEPHVISLSKFGRQKLIKIDVIELVLHIIVLELPKISLTFSA